MQPVIGVTRGARLRNTYRQALEATGAVVREIGADTDRGQLAVRSPRQALAGLNGLMLTGGGDIDPARYGASAVHPTVRVEADRDHIELGLIREALAADLPILGICRGIQSFNVALGGSLWQDLPSERPSPVVHRDPDEDRDRRKFLHPVEVVRGSLLARTVGPSSLWVNSIHHQAIRDLGSGLRSVATAPDGIIEAVETSEGTFALAVQWHPEDLWEIEVRQAALFFAFAEAARSRV